jgi:hypothetical protein
MARPSAVETARSLVRALPETTQQDHHGMASFRVRGRIFATVPDDGHVRVMVNEPEILAAVSECPAGCEPFYWGKRLACVVVDVAAAPAALLEELLAEAWLRRAPRSLAQDFRGRS